MYSADNYVDFNEFESEDNSLKQTSRNLIQKKINMKAPEQYYHELVEHRAELQDSIFNYQDLLGTDQFTYLNAEGPLV